MFGSSDFDFNLPEHLLIFCFQTNTVNDACAHPDASAQVFLWVKLATGHETFVAVCGACQCLPIIWRCTSTVSAQFRHALMSPRHISSRWFPTQRFCFPACVSSCGRVRGFGQQDLLCVALLLLLLLFLLLFLLRCKWSATIVGVVAYGISAPQRHECRPWHGIGWCVGHMCQRTEHTETRVNQTRHNKHVRLCIWHAFISSKTLFSLSALNAYVAGHGPDAGLQSLALGLNLGLVFPVFLPMSPGSGMYRHTGAPSSPLTNFTAYCVSCTICAFCAHVSDCMSSIIAPAPASVRWHVFVFWLLFLSFFCDNKNAAIRIVACRELTSSKNAKK